MAAYQNRQSTWSQPPHHIVLEASPAARTFPSHLALVSAPLFSPLKTQKAETQQLHPAFLDQSLLPSYSHTFSISTSVVLAVELTHWRDLSV